MFAGFELAPLGTLTLRSVFPVTRGDRLLGYLELGKDMTALVARINDILAVDIAIFVHKNLRNRAT